jgi:hypothetical protein
VKRQLSFELLNDVLE